MKLVRHTSWVIQSAGLLAALCAVDPFRQAFALQPEWTFERYQPILDRQPFGRPPPPPVAPVAPPVEPPRIPFTQNLRLTALTQRDGTYRAGIVDLSGQSGQRFYFIFLGESDGALRFKDVDPVGDRVLLEMNGEQEWLGMAKPEPGSAPVAAGHRALPGMPATRFSTAGSPPSPPSPALLSYRERLRARAEAREKRLQEERQRFLQMTQEEVTRKLQEYQMELIRAEGEAGPPIPGVVLTPEMDMQLVKEGVLPPLQEAGSEEPAQREKK